MEHTGHHRNAPTVPGVEVSNTSPVITGPGRDRIGASNSSRAEAGARASTLMADLHEWLAQHDVHPDVLETFMDQVLTALTFQEIVGTHPVHIDSPLNARARQDLARIVVTHAARQRLR